MRLPIAACALLLAALPGGASAQAFPAKLIRLVIVFPPGGTTDTVGRILAQKITENWGVQVLIDNRPGATGMIGADVVAKAPADGYTLAIVTSAHVVHPSLHRKVPFDPIRDFTPVTMLVSAANVIVVYPSLPARSINELVAIARARPGQLVFGSAGTGSSNHLTGEMFKLAAKIDIQHVPYKGGGPIMTDLLGGQIPMAVSQMLTVTPFVKSGKIRALAVTSSQRQPIFPDVPTLIESGYPGFEAAEWFVVLGPAGVPKDVVAKLNAEIDRAMKLPDVQEKIASLGTDYVRSTPEQAGAYMKSEMDKWSRVVKDAGLKPE